MISILTMVLYYTFDIANFRCFFIFQPPLQRRQRVNNSRMDSESSGLTLILMEFWWCQMYRGEAKVDIIYEYTFQKTITYPLWKVGRWFSPYIGGMCDCSQEGI